MQARDNWIYKKEVIMQKNILNIFKSIKGSYNLVDFAKKSKGKSLPRTRASLKEEYEILKQYKEDLLTISDAIVRLTALEGIDKNQAKEIIKNIDGDNVFPMKLK